MSYQQDDVEYFEDATKWFWSEQKDRKGQTWSVEGSRQFAGTKISGRRETTNKVDEAVLKSVVTGIVKGGHRKILKGQDQE